MNIWFVVPAISTYMEPFTGVVTGPPTNVAIHVVNGEIVEVKEV